MDKTVLTLAVDSTQVGTAAAAFDRMVNAGNAAATSAGRVTSAALAEGRTIAQTLVPALTNGINRTRSLDEAQAELGRDASRQLGQNMAAMRSRAGATSAGVRDAVTNTRLSSEQTLPRVVSTVRPSSAVPAVAPSAQVLNPIGTNGITQLASAAAVARLAIERLTEAANGSRTAFNRLTQVAESTARTYRQQDRTPVLAVAQPAPSAAATALATAPQASTNAMREVAQAMSATATQATRAATAVTEANRAIAATPRITAAASVAPAVRAPLVTQSIVSAATGQRVPTATGAPVAQLATDAGRAQTVVERLTAAARAQRGALAELAPAAAAAAGSYRQIAATPIRMEAPQGISATAAALANVATQAQNANRAITGLNRVAPSSQSVASQTISRQTTSTTTTNVGGTAPNAAGMNAFAAAAARGTTAVNGFAAAEGRAAEAAQHLAEANARNEAAQARLAAAIQRVAAAQAALDNASRTGSGGAEAVAQAQTRLQSAQAAVSTATANVARTQRGATEAAERHRTALASVGRQSTLTAHQQQQLSFQLNDFFVQVASGGSPLTALIQQGSQLSGTFGGAGGALRAVLSVFTPLRLAVGGVAGAIGALGYAFYEGSRQSKAFADAVVLTGNYAGQTEGKITALTRQIAAQGQVTANAAREAAQAAISSGQVGPQVFAQATEAIALYAQVTDQTATDVVKDFAAMAQSPSKWAEEHNRTLHFITAAQYDAIKAFEDGGKAADAQAVIYTALIERLHKLDPNLGTIERTLRSVKNAWSSFWDAAYDIGRTETIEGKIASLDAKIRESRRGSNPFAPAAQSRTAQLSGNDPKSLEFELQDQLAGQARKDAEVINEANRSQAQQAGIAAKTVIDGYLKRGKAASAYKDALDKLNRSFKDAEVAGTPVSAADKKVALTELKKEFTPAGSKNGEASQVLRAQLQNDLKSINDAFEKQRDAYQLQNAFVEAAYRAGTVSLGELMEQRRETIKKTAEAQVDALNQEQSRLQQALKQEKDPSTRIQLQTRINEVDVEREKAKTRQNNDVVLLNQEETASFKALSEQVTNYRANLLQMQGDEAGAAALRAQTVIANAKVLAAQATGLPGAPKVDVDGLTRAITLTDQFNEVQRQTSLLAANSSRAEEAFILAAEQSGKSLLETERGLYAMRSDELVQLGALAAKAKELAEASTDPKIKAFAADLALSYAKAANAIDPALNRLRDATRELASGLAQTVGNAPNAFVEFYNQRRSQSEQDIKAQKDEYDRRIDQLRGYLAQEKDTRNKAALQKRINQLQGESDGLKVESKGKAALAALSKTVLEPAAQQVSATISKVLIQDPLQKYLEGQLKGLTEGDGALAGFFKKALGIQADPKQQALLQQTAALNASSSALDTLRAAAENAANSLNKPLLGTQTQQGQAASGSGAGQSTTTQPGSDPTQPPPVDSDLAGVQSKAAESLSFFDKQTTTTASDVLKLASAAGVGGDAMVRLPGIVGLFQSAVMAMTANSAAGGGGIGGFIAKLFGKGDVASSADYAANDWLAAADGGYITGPGTGTSDSIPARLSNGEFVMPAAQTKQFRPVLEQMRAGSMFENAPKYHTGGIVGKAADKVAGKLAKDEVAAVLMGGPKGRREEVLHASDPRHRDNLGMSVVARILAESKAPKSPVAEAANAAKAVESRSSVSTLIRSIAGSKGEGESSATVLAGLLDRIGVKDGDGGNAVKVRGARELGGPVSAGGMYRVNEKGPELLEVAGKQYLMMGSQGGKVESSGSKGDGPVIHQVINFHNNGPVTRQTQQQLAAAAYRGSARASSRNN